MSRPKTPATRLDPICQPNLRRVAKFNRSGGQSWQPYGFWRAAVLFFLVPGTPDMGWWIDVCQQIAPENKV